MRPQAPSDISRGPGDDLLHFMQGDNQGMRKPRGRVDGVCGLQPRKMNITGRGKLSTTTAREQNRALGPQAYGRYPNPGKHRKIIVLHSLREIGQNVPRWW